MEHFYSRDAEVIRSTTSEVRREKGKAISSIVIRELYRLTLQKEGRQVARSRTELLGKDSDVVQVDSQLAVTSAELRQKYGTPMADSIIAATAILLKAACVTDDPHILRIRQVRSRWV